MSVRRIAGNATDHMEALVWGAVSGVLAILWIASDAIEERNRNDATTPAVESS
jgi:hypothetical protein